MHRNLNKEERWVSEYEALVKYIAEGYEEIIYEYTNDLACRTFIQKAIDKKNADILSMLPRIEKSDSLLKNILISTKECIHGNYPKSHFWFWGIPKNSVELMNEAELQKWL